jgi:hypothetical protein
VLGLPLLPEGEHYPLPVLRQRLAPYFNGKVRAYVPDIEDECALRCAVAVAAASLNEEVMMESLSGVGTEACATCEAGLRRLTELANRCYSSRLRVGRLGRSDLRGTRQYRLMRGSHMTRYSREFLSWRVADVDCDNPWDFETSEYERVRFDLELEVLRSLPWTSMVEVGACTGTFTERLVNVFPERELHAYEPNPALFARLKQRLGHRVRLHQAGAEEVEGRCDLLFVSSVLYYLPRFPLGLLDIPERWLVLSHRRLYHDETISPIMRSAGWTCVERRELPPRVENFCEIPILRDGTEVAVWMRS